MQVVQERLGEITVRIVKAKFYATKDEQEVREQFRRKVGDELEIRFEYVDDVERTAAAAFQSFGTAKPPRESLIP